MCIDIRIDTVYMYFYLVFLFILLYFQLFMAVLTIYFLVETVYRYHVRTFPRTCIDTPRRFPVLIFLSICIRTCRYAGTYVILHIFSLYSWCNPVLFHYRYAGTYIISLILFVYSSVIPYYSITPLSCAMTMKQELFFIFRFSRIIIDLHVLGLFFILCFCSIRNHFYWCALTLVF